MHQHTSSTAWANAYLLAEATQDTFQDVHIVTACSEYVRKIQESVIDEQASVGSIDIDAARQLTIERLNKRTDHIHESVRVDDVGIEICVNVRYIDEEATMRALDMLTEALDSLDGKQGTITFGGPIAFAATEVQWLL